jgi:hypothetical protein
VAYKYGYEQEDLYVEQGTERVPDDGQFHIVLRGRVIDREATAKRALGRLQQLRHNLPDDDDVSEESMRQAKLRQGEMATRFLQQSTAEKTAQFGRKS